VEIVPPLRTARPAQRSAGDLFIFPHDKGFSVALTVKDPADNCLTVLPLGPVFPAGLVCPTFTNFQVETAISFGKEYTLRLPPGTRGWVAAEPATEIPSFLVSEDGCLMRAYFDQGGGLKPCYVTLPESQILTSTESAAWPPYRKPRNIAAYAVEWEILTAEKEPRIILKYPF